MKLTLELNTSEKNDPKMMAAIGVMLRSVVEPLYEDEKGEENRTTTPDEKVPQNVFVGEKEEPWSISKEEYEDMKRTMAEMNKPKAARKPRAKKSEETKLETPHVEEAVEVETPHVEEEPVEAEAPSQEEVEKAEAKEEEPASDMPFPDSLPEVEVTATKKSMAEEVLCTPEEWRKIFRQKSIELGLVKPSGSNDDVEAGDHADRRPAFNDYVHRVSQDYGNRIPSQLTDEQRYRFVQQFKRIVWDEENNNFTINSAPF